MDCLLAYIKTREKKHIYKLCSDSSLFETINKDEILTSSVNYSPDHNLDEDAWFKIENFAQQSYSIDLIKERFDSKDYDELKKQDFAHISYLISVQGNDFYFQKITPSLLVTKKFLNFGDKAYVEKPQNRIAINSLPDAVYIKSEDTLIFKNLSTISNIFKGIDELYIEATDDEVNQFLASPFIKLVNNFDVKKVTKPNRMRIARATATLNNIHPKDKAKFICYINNYCSSQDVKFDTDNNAFEISNDQNLKLVLYGIDQRYYTTAFGDEKRLANSIVKIETKHS